MHFRNISALLVLLAASAACGDDSDPVNIGENTRLEILSDPPGAAIYIDGEITGRTTPSTIWDIRGGRRSIEVVLENDGIPYGYRAEVEINGDSLHRVNGPLWFRCASSACSQAASRSRDFGNLRIATVANGGLFTKAGAGEGLLYPLGTPNSYVSMGMPLIGMLAGTSDTLALGIYDRNYLAGRPAPQYQAGPDRITFRQTTWLIPPVNVIINNVASVRGIEIEEQVIGEPDGEVVYVRLTFRNITNRESYRAADPIVPPAGMRFDNVYVGFALDPDIGVADDDMITYAPDDSVVIAYDYHFSESGFNVQHAGRPALIGLKVVEKPQGAQFLALNAWSASTPPGDWAAGTLSERGGYSMLSGLRALQPDHPGQFIGHVPSAAGDYRMLVGAGPVTLEPGDSTAIMVAVIIAPPVEGEFTSGEAVPPGTPDATDRQILRIAGTLLERARNLSVP